MTTICRLLLTLAAITTAAITTPAQENVAKLFRVSSSHDMIITGISMDGLVTWSTEVTGSMTRVEVSDLGETNDWHTYTHVIPTGYVGAVRLWHDATPAGFSLIPAGTFLMGSPTGELGRVSDETQHWVTLTRDFFLQKTEVTNRQMADVLNWARSRGRASVNSSTVRNLEGNQQELLDLDSSYCQISWTGSQLVVDAGKDDYPCVEVTWYGAQAYCNYLSDLEGLNRAVDFSDWSWSLAVSGYRLPTESEWEYACRAGAMTAFYTGGITTTGCSFEPNLDNAGWYCGNAGGASHPVGLKQPNDWGLFDTHGNVWEWCGDWYSSYPGTVTDPTGTTSGPARVRRGGGWIYDALYCRSAYRNIFIRPGISNYFVGVRPSRSVVP